VLSYIWLTCRHGSGRPGTKHHQLQLEEGCQVRTAVTCTLIDALLSLSTQPPFFKKKTKIVAVVVVVVVVVGVFADVLASDVGAV